MVARPRPAQTGRLLQMANRGNPTSHTNRSFDANARGRQLDALHKPAICRKRTDTVVHHPAQTGRLLQTHGSRQLDALPEPAICRKRTGTVVHRPAQTGRLLQTHAAGSLAPYPNRPFVANDPTRAARRSTHIGRLPQTAFPSQATQDHPPPPRHSIKPSSLAIFSFSKVNTG